MPPKRKLRLGENEQEEGVLLKKVKGEANEDTEETAKDINNDATYREVLEHLYKQRDAEDRPLWKMFDVLPSEEEFPVYYEFIKEPIDLKTIKKKIQTHQYNSIDELEVDILLVFKNAHAFNEPKSQISKDATQMKKAYLTKRIELNKSLLASKVGRRLKERLESRSSAAGDSEHSEVEEMKVEDLKLEEGLAERILDPESLSRQILSPVDKKDDGLIDETFEHNALSILYNMVAAFRDPSGRQMSMPFMRLPIRRSNPGYFDVVKKPLALQKIRTKIKGGYYSDLNILAKDICSVFENAQLYYDEGTVMYGDAGFLLMFTNEKKCELEKTSQYIEWRENMPKRGRPRVPKEKERRENSANDDGTLTPGAAVKRKVKQASTPDTVDPKVQKERLLLMYNTVCDYKDSDGRSLSTMFLELPDPEEYPEYYKVIPHPIDMERIHEKIINGVYGTEMDFIHDFEILFQNARHFNEEGSEIYEDSVILEKALKKKRRYLNHIADGKDQSPGKCGRQSSPSCVNRSQELLHHIRSYADDTGRVLSAIFERLPSRVEYPDYYILIKRPIDLMYIAGRAQKYPSIDDLEQDLLLLFNNACIYNEPDSQIYKDALTLLRIMTQKKNELVPPEVENDIPDVAQLVQGLLTKLFTNTMDHRDEEGRCYSDSLLEVSVDDCSTPTGEPDERRRKAISLTIIGQLLKLGFYKRLDVLQNDVFSILKEARKNASIDSEMFEDACELNTFFILERDVLTKEGVRMISPALNTTGKLVQQEIDHERKEKMQIACLNKADTDEEARPKGRFKEAVTFEVTPAEGDLTFSSSVIHNGVMYQIGDYAYVKPEDPTRRPNVISIDKIWQQTDGLQGIYGCWYYRPDATFHLASRKFMERELFRSSQFYSFIMLNGVVGRCYVMNVKEHIKFKPQNFNEEDIYVCESRYVERGKGFTKIKHHPPTAVHITMVARDTPLQIKRLPSIFAVPSQPDGKKDEQLEQKKSLEGVALTTGCELPSTQGYEVPMDRSCEVDVVNPEEGCMYYEKYLVGRELWKIGDCVYVKDEEDYLLLSRIDRLWTDSSGTALFRGFRYIAPEDTKHLPTQFFMEMECFESNIEETYLISSIAGRCVILNQKDYINSRPTEIPEKDVYVCNSHYIEDELKFKKNLKGFKKLSVSEHIRDDEYWISDRTYPARRRPSRWLTSADATKDNEEREAEKRKDLDVAAFTLMKKEYAAGLMKENPEIPLQDIELKTVECWATLSDEAKEEFRVRAKNQGLGDDHMFIFQCCWASCQYQFEDLQDLMIHVMEGPHLSILSSEGSSAVYSCEWRECERLVKRTKPFHTHSRLVRHIREIHFKNASKKILASQKGKFYFPRHQTCEEMFKGSENSDRPSSRGSSTASSLSPSGHLNKLNNRHQPMSPGMMPPGAPGGHMYPNPMHMQAGMFPPYRMNGQPTPQAIMQQQIMQQQQLMMQARGQMLSNAMNNGPPQMMNSAPPQMMNNTPPQMMNNPMNNGPPQQMMNNAMKNGPPQQMMNNAMNNGPQQMMNNVMNNGPPMMNNAMNNGPPQMMNNAPPQMMNNTPPQMMNNTPPQMMNNAQQRPPHMSAPPPHMSAPPPPPPQHPQQGGGGPMLSMEQQQMLIGQVQRQQQQIQKLQQQVQGLVVQQQQQKALEEQQEQQSPVFVAPPSNNVKLRHSEAYLRYIEGLRDNKSSLSNWSEIADSPHPKANNQNLPTEWLADGHGFDSAVDALWALRDHMLRDAVSISKIL